jgi:enolase
MINGASMVQENLRFSGIFVIPASSKSFTLGLQSCSEIYITIGQNLAKRGAIHSVGFEGGYAPNLFTNADALEILVEAIRNTGYQMGIDIFLGLDVAAQSFFSENTYKIRDKAEPLDEDRMIEYYKELNNLYHLAVLEDGLAEDSWEGWVKLRKVLGEELPIVGDDLLATNIKRVEKAVSLNACNAILVKPNQIGTITETLKVIKKAHEANWKIIVSHRSGETNDYFIADFAVGVGADYVKFGAPARGERVAKYNRLLAIESELTPSQT